MSSPDSVTVSIPEAFSDRTASDLADALLMRVRMLEVENATLRKLHEHRCERVAAASEVIAKLAEKRCPKCGWDASQPLDVQRKLIVLCKHNLEHCAACNHGNVTQPSPVPPVITEEMRELTRAAIRLSETCRKEIRLGIPDQPVVLCNLPAGHAGPCERVAGRHSKGTGV